MDPHHAVIDVSGEEQIEVQYNPEEFTLSKGVQLAEIPIPGLDSPLIQFVRGQTETLTVELFFDTTDHGTGANATSVTTLTDRIYDLVKIQPHRHAPPTCTFHWGRFPGNDLPDSKGGQKRPAFRGVVEDIKQRFTLFSPDGVPLRATLTVTFKEFKPLDKQLHDLNLNSPDRTQAYVVARGDTLSAIAGRQYQQPAQWRRVADANLIDDPRRLTVGRTLRIPPMSGSVI